MALPLFQEKRFSPRKKLTGLLPGKLLNKNTEEQLQCKVVDVSDHGMGITTKQELKLGMEITLETGNESLDFKVAWLQKDFGKSDLFRIGLLCNDSEANIQELFAKEGCLK